MHLVAAEFFFTTVNGSIFNASDVRFVNTRAATGMDGTLPHCNFENLKPVEISKNCFNFI